MEDSGTNNNNIIIPFESIYVHEAINKASQTQRLLVIYVEGWYSFLL